MLKLVGWWEVGVKGGRQAGEKGVGVWVLPWWCYLTIENQYFGNDRIYKGTFSFTTVHPVQQMLNKYMSHEWMITVFPFLTSPYTWDQNNPKSWRATAQD